MTLLAKFCLFIRNSTPFLEAKPDWIYYDEAHTHSHSTFTIPISDTNRFLRCVLKRHEASGKMRCFGSTMSGLDAQGILEEYGNRWTIENGIKDLVGDYYFDNTPGIQPHRINIHYFVVTLARLLYHMFCKDYPDSLNPDGTMKTIGTLRREFLTGTNATLTREGDRLIITWNDSYPESKQENIQNFLSKFDHNTPLPFLGGLKLKFQVAPPRSDNLRNQLKRVRL